jgi:hypothetical protein
MMELNALDVAAARLRRQCLTDPVATEVDYLKLFRLMQPVAPPAYSRPGDPPKLEKRVAFDDRECANRLRRERIIVKGRFLSGNVGYVFAEQLATYAAAFRRPLSAGDYTLDIVQEVVQRHGPITIGQIKEETGLLSKQIVPALHKLQRSFLVYEDQVDEDWERGWYDFETEWPGLALEDTDPLEARAAVIRDFLQVHVFATERHISDWSGLSLTNVRAAVDSLLGDPAVSEACTDRGEEGWVFGDVPNTRLPADSRRVIMLTRSDMLIRSHKTELKRRFSGREVLRFLLVHGEPVGAVIGHWRIGPHDVDDIVIQVEETDGIRDEAICEVASAYHPPYSTIQKYAGKDL